MSQINADLSGLSANELQTLQRLLDKAKAKAEAKAEAEAKAKAEAEAKAKAKAEAEAVKPTKAEAETLSFDQLLKDLAELQNKISKLTEAKAEAKAEAVKPTKAEAKAKAKAEAEAVKPTKAEAVKPTKAEAKTKTGAQYNFEFIDISGNKFDGEFAVISYSDKSLSIEGEDTKIICEALKTVSRWNKSTKTWFMSRNRIEEGETVKQVLNRAMYNVFGVSDAIK